MKNEKLELLLNKVVEFNQPDVAYYKGFLYKDSNGYYIKVVEGILGKFFLNDKVRLKEGDEQFIIQAEKPKLMRVSLKSWHYRLIKYVLGDSAPTPKTMQNGCPYFWLLIFSILVVPFVLLWQGSIFVILLFPRAFIWCLEQVVISWMDELDDAHAKEIQWEGKSKMPLTAKIFFNQSDQGFFEYFLSKKYNLRYGDPDYNVKKNEINERWEEWRKEASALRDKRREEYYQKENKRIDKEMELRRKRQANKEKWEKRLQPMEDAINKILDGIVKAFTIKADWKFIIKRTKQFVGAIVTLALLVFTYYFVNVFAYCLMLLIDAIIEYWYIPTAGVGAVGVVGICYILYIFVTGWLQGVISKYENGKRVWYVEPFIYAIWYPIKYVSMFIAYSIFYVIWKPIEMIFVKFLWKFIIVNISMFIWNLILKFGTSLKNSTGVFGEYFGASYSDYCPGIEWADNEEDQD